MENDKIESVQGVAKVEQKQVAKYDFNSQIGLKQFIFTDPKKMFLSQITDQNAETIFNREASFALQIVNNIPTSGKDFFIKTLAANPQSFVSAIANVASSGLTLDPSLKLAYLVPMDGKISFWPSWMGKKEKAIQTGLTLNLYAELVYKNDLFEYYAGTNRNIIHKPNVFSDRGEIIGGYAVAIMTNGEKEFAVMNFSELEKIRMKSKMANSGAWISDKEEMYKKTLINRLFKSVPKMKANTELISLLKAEQESENTDFNSVKEISQSNDFYQE